MESGLVTIQVNACLTTSYIESRPQGTQSSNSANATSSSSSASASAVATATATAPAPLPAAVNSPAVGKIEVDRSWLTTEFFQAKLERWQNGPKPLITLQIPSECNAAEGAQLLYRRLASAFERSAKETSGGKKKAAIVANIPWAEMDWWMAVDDKIGCFSALLHIFHMTMLEPFAKEVLAAIKCYRLPCTKSAISVASDLGFVQDPVESVGDPINDLNMLKIIFKGAGNNMNPTAWTKLADRALSPAQASKQLMDILIEAYFSMFEWPEAPPRHTCYRKLSEIPVYGKPRPLYEQLAKWFEDRIFRILFECPAAVETIAETFLKKAKKIETFKYVPLRLGPNVNEYLAPDLDTRWADTLLPLCSSAFWVGSNLKRDGPPISKEVVADFIALFRQPFSTAHVGTALVATMDPNIFAIGSLEMQLLCLQGPSAHFYEKNLRNHAHLVHEKARHLLVKDISILTAKDLAFLAEAPFPGMELAASGPAKAAAK
eukprot:CAMPEP_0206530906 /NCGR_PEP_ID=MMETSP0325_2-20121206/3459_1 /ASSEMBLY_ACC=CAM_ASM_000347 /TAXON_ID=2866 /ORGANISM="Crypthecodinium cohnii, Strain Seligo" /LENGTH=489 /DNA_ID=CAMNT_0054027069 /DNA_START=218 /DNA_END=1687 /DNA_ORIENTATION=+